VGGWAVRPGEGVVTRLLEDVPSRAVAGIAREAARISVVLDGTPVTPSFPTPLEKELRTSVQ
ncbi:winged helix DNA-binding domain-containing protein, partial [Rhodococcus kroppenstedtii]|nr:winged helix DNA-binding domain-containing protein [Rhodococcus kroppenstedtii]